MAILHIISKSPFNCLSMESGLNICSGNDAVILINDGVLGAITSSPLAATINRLSASGAEFDALENDLIARGITEKLLTGIKPISYQGFVKLTVKFKLAQSWY